MSLLEDRNARCFLNFLRDGLPYVAEVFYEAEAGLREAVEDGFSQASRGRIGV
jgi:hypothetical protein